MVSVVSQPLNTVLATACRLTPCEQCSVLCLKRDDKRQSSVCGAQIADMCHSIKSDSETVFAMSGVQRIVVSLSGE